MSFDLPDPQVVDGAGKATAPWLAWLSRVHSIVITAQQSGPTADRPTSQVWIGRQFFDTTLNKPIYVTAVKPIVWRDAVANIV